VTIFIAGIAFILYVLVAYPLWIAVWSRMKSQPVLKDFSPRTVSILLPVHNGDPWLEKKLRTIRELNYPME